MSRVAVSPRDLAHQRPPRASVSSTIRAFSSLAPAPAALGPQILRLAKGRAGAHRDTAQNRGLHIVAHCHDAAPGCTIPHSRDFSACDLGPRFAPRRSSHGAGLDQFKDLHPLTKLPAHPGPARDLQRRDPAGIGFIAVMLGSPLKVSRHSLQARLRCAGDGKLTQNRLNSGPRVFQDREKFKVFLIIHWTPRRTEGMLSEQAL